jgi:hypothetical protein
MRDMGKDKLGNTGVHGTIVLILKNGKYDNGIKEKIQALQVMCGTIDRKLKNKTLKDTKLKCYEVMATPVWM